ncbi:MAG: efflux RND transporter periplasmic adaptor subunit [Bacteroidales bacterium]|nr:efflux RND transporter periplasmic adaptor subunit [Bacteroidales bacterium]
MINKFKYSALVFAAAALSIQSCGDSKKADGAATETQAVKSEVVSVKKIEKKEVMRILSFSAVLQAYQKVNVAPALQGRIMKVNCEVGDRVSQGQMIAQMDETQYISTKVQYENNKVDFNRIKILNDSNNISKQTFDQAKAGLEVLETSLANLERNTYLRAPFSGVISAKNYEPGELMGQMPIYELIQLNVLKALVQVPETYFPFVKEGMKLNVKSETYPDQTFPATVEVVYPTIDANSHTFSIKVKIPNPKSELRPGMYISTDLEMGKAEAIVVPYNSVQKLQGSDERFVFINDNGTAHRVVVQFGQRFNDEIELIADEIKPGVELIIQGAGRLHEGSKLDIKPLTTEK